MANLTQPSDVKRVIRFATIAFGILLLVILSFKFIDDVNADEIVINQVPMTGTLNYWTTPGWKMQLFGATTHYKKSYQIWFSEKDDQGEAIDDAIKVVFNDGGNGWISGSIRILLPTDPKHLNAIHTTFGSMETLIHELVKPTVTKVVFATGPLMNSYESYAAKKNDLIRYIEDQLKFGTYRTLTKQQKITDELSGKEKMVTVAELSPDTKSPGGLARQEDAPFSKFGIKVAAVSIESIRYEDVITQQIASQQKAQMEVQTAIAETRKQEQQLIQEQKRGEKNATVAKWEQEVEKAKMVTRAEQQREVARLDMEAAEFTKQKEILLGQGESERKRLVMNADGQLTIKLEYWLKAQETWAKNIASYQGNWVPTTIIGNTGTGTNGAQTFMDLMMMKAAKDLSFNPNPTK